MMDFDFLGSFHGGQLLEDELLFRNNTNTINANFGSAQFNCNNGSAGLDREYVWEGDEQMYDDIVASTQPLNYNPAFLRKFDYNSGFNYHPHIEGFDDEDSIIHQEDDGQYSIQEEE